jgi:hypothetical protein
MFGDFSSLPRLSWIYAHGILLDEEPGSMSGDTWQSTHVIVLI